MFEIPPHYHTRLWVHRDDSKYDIFDVVGVEFSSPGVVELQYHGETVKVPGALKPGFIKVHSLAYEPCTHEMMKWFHLVNASTYGPGAPYKREATLVFRNNDGTVENWQVLGAFPISYEVDDNVVTVHVHCDTVKKLDPNGKPTAEELTAKTLTKYGVELVT